MGGGKGGGGGVIEGKGEGTGLLCKMKNKFLIKIIYISENYSNHIYNYI